VIYVKRAYWFQLQGKWCESESVLTLVQRTVHDSIFTACHHLKAALVCHFGM
jgi:hypothetical protein